MICHMVQFGTPKAFANLSPGFEEREPWDPIKTEALNPERVRQWSNPFRVVTHLLFIPRVVALRAPTLG